jgi:hypothetical protein
MMNIFRFLHCRSVFHKHDRSFAAHPIDSALKLLFYERDSRSCRVSCQLELLAKLFILEFKSVIRGETAIADVRIKLDVIIFLCQSP